MKDYNKIFTQKDILDQLYAANIPRDKVVLMHSSLRAIGNVDGGASTLLDAMIEYFTESGGLFCVPTHTWAFTKREITLDISDPITCLGAFSNVAAADTRGIRSENPTHSMMVFGDRQKAIEFIKDDENVVTCTSPNSCYGKIFERQGLILLVGVSHNKNTYLHCVEEILGVPNRLSVEPRLLTVRRTSGEIVQRSVHTHHTDFTRDISARFPKYETAFRYYGAIKDTFIGNAPTQLCDARIMKEVMELIKNNSNDIDPLADEKAIDPKLFCQT